MEPSGHCSTEVHTSKLPGALRSLRVPAVSILLTSGHSSFTVGVPTVDHKPIFYVLLYVQ